MNRIKKFLAKLSYDERVRILAIYEKIYAGDFRDLSLKKLQGATDEYRVRVGRIRIKFTMSKTGINIYYVGYRDDTTY